MKNFLILSLLSTFSLATFAQIECDYQPDIESDYLIGVSDILAVLGLFGEVDLDQDGIWDSEDLCTDLEACNFDLYPSEACQFFDMNGNCGGDTFIPDNLIGSWTFSTIEGAITVGSNPYGSNWHVSPPNSLNPVQYDDVYTFNEDGTLSMNYNGLILDAFLDYSVQQYDCDGVDVIYNFGGGTSGEDLFTLVPNNNDCSCPFFGTTDASMTYEIVELTSTTLVLHSQIDNSSCETQNGYFTFTFVKINEGVNNDYQGADSYPNMDLIWSDEFEGSSINTQNWTYDIGASGWGNNELQNYTSSSSNSFVSNGYLNIVAKEENGGYTSARLKSIDLQEYQFGRIDVRAKLPEGQGIWPAIWMLGHNFPTSGWPACGEIDIMELIGNEPSTVHGTAHWGTSWNVHQYSGDEISLPAGQKFSDAFHLFSIIWTENSITWLMDDQPYYSIDNTQMNGQPYPFNNSFFFIMNIAVGGNWPGYPNSSTIFPQTMQVDYVRVFQ